MITGYALPEEAVGAYVNGVYVRRTVNTVQAAEIAGVSRRTIFNWMRLGAVEVARTPMGGVRIYADTLLRKAKSPTTSSISNEYRWM